MAIVSDAEIQERGFDIDTTIQIQIKDTKLKFSKSFSIRNMDVPDAYNIIHRAIEQEIEKRNNHGKEKKA